MLGTAAAARPIEASPARYGETKSQAIERLERELESYLESKALPLREKGIVVRCSVVIGDPAESIIDFARRQRVELIAMATHGRTGLARLMFGSVAGRVLRSGVAPVLLVRPRGLKRE